MYVDGSRRQSFPEPKKGFDIARAVERIEYTVSASKRIRKSRKDREEYNIKKNGFFMEMAQKYKEDVSKYTDYSKVIDGVIIKKGTDKVVDLTVSCDEDKLEKLVNFLKDMEK